MTIVVKRPVKIEVETVRLQVPIYNGEEDLPNDFPFRSNGPRGDLWRVKIDIESGRILGWPRGKAVLVKLKVCDGGSYTLISPNGMAVETLKGYVPHGLVPGEYGDYIELRINDDGVIKNWPKQPDLTEFFKGDE